MSAQHTPGPWIWRGKSGSLHQVGEAPYTYGQSVLEPSYEYDSGVDTVVSEADADLIAAAPDLLAALKLTYAALSRPDIYTAHPVGLERTVAHDAIAKAEGRS